MSEVKEDQNVFDAKKVLDKVSERINVKSRTHLAKEIGVAQSTLHYNEAQNDLPWRMLVNYAVSKGWSIDELLDLKADQNATASSKSVGCEKPNTDFILKCSKVVTKIIEQYVVHPDVRQRRLSEARLSELRIDLVEVLMRIALDTQCNEVLIDATCRSILTIKQAY